MQTTTKPLEVDPVTATVQPGLRPVPLTLFPTLDNVESVINLGISQLPIHTPNELVCLLMTYHNSLLKQTQEQSKHEEAA